MSGNRLTLASLVVAAVALAGSTPLAAQGAETNRRSESGVVARDFLEPAWYAAPTSEGSRSLGSFLDPAWYALPTATALNSAASHIEPLTHRCRAA